MWRGGDFDGDGDLDLATGNEGGPNMLYLNDGAGGFGDSQNFGTGHDPTVSVAWGDFDGDGDLDLAVGNSGEQSMVYVNDGSGRLGDVVNFGGANDYTHALAWG